MKSFKFLMLVFGIGLLFCSCRYLPEKNVRHFIPGMYVNYAKGEYSLAYDTLLIQLMDEQSDAYRIYRNTAFQRLENLQRDGGGDDVKPGKMERRSEVWTAAYDQTSGVLLESKKGKIIAVYPDSGLIVVGTRLYRKIQKE